MFVAYFFVTVLIRGAISALSGFPLEAGALTVDLEAAGRAFDQLFVTPWIKEVVTLVKSCTF